MGIERRQYKRYRVVGRAEFQGDSARGTGELVDIGTGGVLIRSHTVFEKGASIWTQFAVAGFPGTFAARGRIVRTQLDVLAVMFLELPEGLEELLAWLEHRTPPQPQAPA